MRDLIRSACPDVSTSTAGGKRAEGTSSGSFFPVEDGWDHQLSGDVCVSDEASEEVWEFGRTEWLISK